MHLLYVSKSAVERHWYFLDVEIFQKSSLYTPNK